MAVNLSPYGGVGAQFLDNSGNVLTGGKIYTYSAGTTTPQPTYTTSAGNIPHSNPIILDAAGRVPSGGEIWLTDGLSYKFILRDANDVLIATYDNVTGINSNFVAFTNQQEIQIATAGQTVFDLTTMQYQPGTNNLSVFVDGVNQYGPGAQYAYLETDSDTVTFVNGLHVGAEVKFMTSQLNSSGLQANAFQVSYTPPLTGSVGTNVGDKLAQTVSVLDFGADPTGVSDSTVAFQNAYNSNAAVINIPAGTFLISSTISIDRGVSFIGSGGPDGSGGSQGSIGVATTKINYIGTGPAFEIIGSYAEGVTNVNLANMSVWGTASADGGLAIGTGINVAYSTFKNLHFRNFTNVGVDLGYGIGVFNCLQSVFENVYCQSNTVGINILGTPTSLTWISCSSRTNNTYGWLIQSLIGSSFYECLAESNVSSGLVINPPNGKVVQGLGFYSWYSENNATNATDPACLIRTTGTGINYDINFYTAEFYDFNALPILTFGFVNNIHFRNSSFNTLNANFASCAVNTTKCSIEVSALVPSTNVTGNAYSIAEGAYNVQLISSQGIDFDTNTWTPTITSGGTGSGGVGRYQKIGNIVTINGAINITAITGTLVIAGLPYAVNSTLVSAVGISTGFGAITVLNTIVTGTNLNISYSSTYSGGAITIYFSASYSV